jgi:RNA polymerase sigma factor (sigma-70 family)
MAQILKQTMVDFNTLLVQEQQGLHRFAKKLTGVSADAEDLVQETFLKALKYKSRFVEGSNLRAWLFTIMKNTFVNDYRRVKKGREVLGENLRSRYSAQDCADFEHKLHARQIVVSIGALPDAYSRPFISHYLGFRYEEIAASTGVPVGTVKSRIFLARKMLRNTLLRLEAA